MTRVVWLVALAVGGLSAAGCESCESCGGSRESQKVTTAYQSPGLIPAPAPANGQ